MREMKDSGVRWLGDIPCYWKVMRVKHGFFRKKMEAHQDNPVVLSLARAGVRERDISNNEGQIAESYYNYNPVDVDDLLINPMDLYSGANCSISKIQGVISQAYINLRYKPGFDPKYYDYYFKIQYWMMAFFAHGKGVSFENRWTLNAETLMNYPIIVPSLDEQKRIADYLDSKCSKIDEIIAKQEQIIEKLKEYKLSVITEAVTKGLDSKVEMKDSGVEYICKVPKKWRVVKFKHIIRKKIDNRGRTPDLLDDNKGIPVVEVASLGGKHPDLSKVKKYISNESHDLFIRDDVERGDILVTTVGATIGKCSIVDKPDFCIAQNLVGYRVDSEQVPLFWYYYFQSKVFQDMFSQYDKGNTINNVKISNMEQGYVVVAPQEEQAAIVDFLDLSINKLEKEITRRIGMIEKLADYKKSLIYEVVTGKKEV